VKGIFERMASV